MEVGGESMPALDPILLCCCISVVAGAIRALSRTARGESIGSISACEPLSTISRPNRPQIHADEHGKTSQSEDAAMNAGALLIAIDMVGEAVKQTVRHGHREEDLGRRDWLGLHFAQIESRLVQRPAFLGQATYKCTVVFASRVGVFGHALGCCNPSTIGRPSVSFGRSGVAPGTGFADRRDAWSHILRLRIRYQAW